MDIESMYPVDERKQPIEAPRALPPSALKRVNNACRIPTNSVASADSDDRSTPSHISIDDPNGVSQSPEAPADEESDESEVEEHDSDADTDSIKLSLKALLSVVRNTGSFAA
ncbi:hypothetical protein OEA41_008037 [Lepraria neglecta]|uniref:Uncharacterized protein n=1 Tax=Lepraria neglecta TaxID=209136 RepID=A0AAE0DNU2_9LECA|nr:hypothetical protein OEA41_008037 [Lepraria neglecta]